MQAELNTLATLLAKLPAKDQGFAADLVAKGNKYGCSAGQAKWVKILIDRANGKTEERVKTQIGNLDGIIARFNVAAASKLKFPKIALGIKRDGWIEEFQVSIAGERARVPGSLNVKGGDKWFGRILRDGNFEQSPREQMPEGLLDLLKEFAEKPAETAAAYGRLTGRCFACNLPLKDERSTLVGYGQTCAKKWGLPWGAKA